MHVVRYVNPAFCRLINEAEDAFVGRPFCDIFREKDECLAMLDGVYRTGKSESHTEQDHSDPRTVFSSYTMWPVVADEGKAGIMIQVIETAPLREKVVAMNEALILGSLRQHELTEAADSSNVELQTEIGDSKQRERDALTLTNEVAHRMKNNLQIVVSLIANEVRRTAAPCVQGYEAMQARIASIAELYDLISRSSPGAAISVGAYLKEIAKTMSASLLAETSDIRIEVEAEALTIDPDRAVPFGLLVNELTTNAIKHAFPDGRGTIVLSAEQIGDQIELTIADNGVGLKDQDSAKAHEKHGADYVAIFLRQLSGTVAASGSEGTGTTVRMRFPLLVVPQGATSE